ncbi:MAG: DUF2382 domain-containing protein [Oculatellaceae cyanobacterium Prado106]|jgi:uncharacterized protein (TIGR02271 family)|nr:DUF2382 domain-containing protein [Oculatellaceae cyanobacterium Prado106]
MVLVKLETYYPDYRDIAGDRSDVQDFKNFDVYAADGDKVGSVYDVLVDADTGRFRYFVVDTGFWIFGKKVLLPVGQATIDPVANQIQAIGLLKDQINDLPNFDNLEEVDFDYEERVRGIYRPSTAAASATAMSSTSPSTYSSTTSTPMGSGSDRTSYDRNSYSYDNEPELYNLNQDSQQAIRLYEERLVADKQRRKAGEVTVGKHTETETTRVAVPVEKERVVIERTAPTGSTVADPNHHFGSETVAQVEVYEETPDIRKEAFVREEVKVKKVTEQDTVSTQETIRREELDVDTTGQPTIDRSSH